MVCCSKLKLGSKADMAIDITEMNEDWEQVGGTSLLMHNAVFNPHDFAVTDNYHVFFQVTPALQDISYHLFF